MTSAAQTAQPPQVDWRVIVSGGAILGVVTAIGVVVFARLARTLDGSSETAALSVLVLVGGLVFAYFPSTRYAPREVDSIAWVALIGLMGALFFTFIDTAVLRPLDTYSWRWDAIGGGSGLWYIPVWWMGSALLAGLGAWTVANTARSGAASVPVVVAITAVIAIVIAAILVVSGIVSFSPAGVALALTIGLVLHVPLSAVMHRG